MVSGVGASPSFLPPLNVSHDDEAGYAVNGQVADEEAVNALLKPYGLGATGGQFFGEDGFDLNGPNAHAATSFGGPAPLPGVRGQVATVSAAQQQSNWMNELGDGALMWLGMAAMANLAIKDKMDAMGLRNAMTTSKFEMKEAKIDATGKQIGYEREAAHDQFVYAVSAAVVTAVIQMIGAGVTGFGGDLFGMSASQATTWGSAVNAVAASKGEVVSKYGDLKAKSGGAEAKANEAKMMAKRYEMLEAQFDSAIDEAKAAYDQAKEQFKLALQILQDHMERQTQVVQAITS